MILFSEDSIRVGERLFLFAKSFNMLFSIDIADGNITFLGGIPGEQALLERGTCRLIYWEEQILVIPLLFEKIWIYSLKSKAWKEIDIGYDRQKISQTKFRQAIVRHGFLYLIGGHCPAVLKMDLETHQISYIEEPFLYYRKKETEELYFRGDFVYREGTVYLASCRDNSVLALHLDTQSYKRIEIGGKENRYSGIAWDGSHYWIAPRINTPIVKWDGKDHVTEYEIPAGKRKNRISYSGIVERANQMLVPALAGSGADTIILNRNGEMDFADERYTFYKKTQEGEYLSQDSRGNLIFMNDKGEKRQFSCAVASDAFCKLFRTLNVTADSFAKKINMENAPFSLFELMELTGKRENLPANGKRNAGAEIWKAVCGPSVGKLG